MKVAQTKTCEKARPARFIEASNFHLQSLLSKPQFPAKIATVSLWCPRQLLLIISASCV